jgi:hypothetical protein
MMIDSLEKAQELSLQEQEMVLDVTEKFADQLRSGFERVSKFSVQN